MKIDGDEKTNEILKYVSKLKEIANDLYTIEYAKENDSEYGRCSTCKNYGKCYVCSDCDEGSEYKFDLIHYQRKHDDEISKWIEENKMHVN